MLRELFAALAAFATLAMILLGVAMLTGCAREGAGFSNDGSYQGPIRCVEERPGYTRCYSI